MMIDCGGWVEQCQSSSGWLGMSSQKVKIRESGLWLVNQLYKTAFTDDEIREFEGSI
jgi:hypothetical protein